MPKFTQQQLESIQFDYGIVIVDYGETSQRKLGPTRGGATFEATQTIRDIEFDGRQGKSKGMQVVDMIDAKLNFSQLSMSRDDLKLAMPYLEETGDEVDGYVLECNSTSLGIVPDTAYMKNITVFGKVTGGGFKKVTVFNAMNEAPTSIAAVPNGEATVAMEVFGHWETVDTATVEDLFTIEDVSTITEV